MRRKGEEDINYAKERQGELFSEFETVSAKGPQYALRRNITLGKKIAINLSYENAVLLFIAFIMLAVVIFSLGVEKGKRAAAKVTAAAKETPAAPVAEAPARIKEAEKITPGAPEKAEKTENKKPAPPPAKEEAADRPYTIQIVALKDKAAAEREMARLKKEGYDAFIIPSDKWIQICVGRYANKKDSEKDFKELKNKYPSCYFRKIKQ